MGDGTDYGRDISPCNNDREMINGRMKAQTNCTRITQTSGIARQYCREKGRRPDGNWEEFLDQGSGQEWAIARVSSENEGSEQEEEEEDR